MPPIITKRALIVVKTYPVPSESGIESSCTAAITDSGEWLRLYPVPWRLLANDQRFRKYQWVEVDVTKAPSDPRPESHHLVRDGIRILSNPLPNSRHWQAKKDVVYPLSSPSLCWLSRQRDANFHPTLGLFRPSEIRRLRFYPEADPDWSESQRLMLRQTHLFVEPPREELQKIPYKFVYEFRCDDDDCRGHNLMCTDWEMLESYREWTVRYGDRWQEKFRLRYEEEMIRKNDTHFFVGTVASHPHSWIIIGLFYPTKDPAEGQGRLF
ncbi:MAG: hypothetical protein IH602_07870 [Bryobacteraceae bacterium]|nr:hypothetical protein [Bryobacteraceae bacterium]